MTVSVPEPQYYETAINHSKLQTYNNLWVGARLVAWIRYKMASGKTAEAKANALFSEMSIDLAAAGTNEEAKQKIAEKYGRALGAIRKNLEGNVSEEPSKAVEAFRKRISAIATPILEGTGLGETVSLPESPKPPPLPLRPIIDRVPGKRIENAQNRGTPIADLPPNASDKAKALIARMKDGNFEADDNCYFNIAATIIALSAEDADTVLKEIISTESGVQPTTLLLLAEALFVGKEQFKDKLPTLIKGFVIKSTPGEAKKIRDILVRNRDDESVGQFYNILYKTALPPLTVPKPMFFRTSPSDRLKEPEAKGIGSAHVLDFETEKDAFIDALKAATLEQDPNCYFTLSEIFKDKPLEVQETILTTAFDPKNGIPYNRLLLFAEAVALKYPETQKKIIEIFRDQLIKPEWESIRKYLESDKGNHPLADMYKGILHDLPPTMPPRSPPKPVPSPEEEEPEEVSSSGITLPAPQKKEVQAQPQQSVDEELTAKQRARSTQKPRAVVQPQTQGKKELGTMDEIEAALESKDPPYGEIKEALLRQNPIVRTNFLKGLKEKDEAKYNAIGIQIPPAKK